MAPRSLPRWQLPTLAISKHTESVVAGGTRFLFPSVTRDIVRAVPWLTPHFADERGRMRNSIHMLIVDGPAGFRLAVDPCVGNDKRRNMPAWNMQNSAFLQELEEAGFPLASFTHVLCTHLHVDHVGFNTTLDRQTNTWQPTFPNAQYFFERSEFEYWRTHHDSAPAASDDMKEVMADSVLPIVRAGLHHLCAPDEVLFDQPHEDGTRTKVYLRPTPGHTPGHVSLVIEDRGQAAIITGDCIHHPIQLAIPEVCSAADWDGKLAYETRLDVLRRAAGSALLFGTHFAPPSCGRVHRVPRDEATQTIGRDMGSDHGVFAREEGYSLEPAPPGQEARL